MSAPTPLNLGGLARACEMFLAMLNREKGGRVAGEAKPAPRELEASLGRLLFEADAVSAALKASTTPPPVIPNAH